MLDFPLSGYVYSSSGTAGARVARDSGMISNEGCDVTYINGVILHVQRNRLMHLWYCIIKVILEKWIRRLG